MSRLLISGIATLDIINSVAEYPAEDTEVRALQQRIVRGGNGANSACLLAGFGHQVEFAGNLADDSHGDFIRRDLQTHHVGLRYSHTCSNSRTPTSYITLSQQSGSRTIVHYRDLAEYDASGFDAIGLEEFDWFHFEGRNIGQTRKMMDKVRHCRVDQPVSLEIEKHREDIDSLLPLADIILFSRAYARQSGFDSPTEFLQQMYSKQPQSMMICTWAEQGAWARSVQGEIQHCPAFAVDRVVDTIGAGDTFNAAFIDAMCAGKSLAQALQAGCQLAGRKVAQAGFEHLFEDDKQRQIP